MKNSLFVKLSGISGLALFLIVLLLGTAIIVTAILWGIATLIVKLVPFVG